jgi:putative GTP pyrophosphokinase
VTGEISKTQIDLLGDRLRDGSPADVDLRMLDDYRRSFGEAYEFVVQTIRQNLSLEPTGRPAKSTGAVIEKLHRETIRLSQVQDIAGCRIVVAGIVEQERVVEALRTAFEKAAVADRRANPSYGYRAVHVIVEVFGRLVEVQVRTFLQHTWAEISEKLSDVLDPAIKYGGGADQVKGALANGSTAVDAFEQAERVVDLALARTQDSQEAITEEARRALSDARTRLVDVKKQLDDALRKSVSAWVEEQGPRR